MHGYRGVRISVKVVRVLARFLWMRGDLLWDHPPVSMSLAEKRAGEPGLGVRAPAGGTQIWSSDWTTAAACPGGGGGAEG